MKPFDPVYCPSRHLSHHWWPTSPNDPAALQPFTDHPYYCIQEGISVTLIVPWCGKTSISWVLSHPRAGRLAWKGTWECWAWVHCCHLCCPLCTHGAGSGYPRSIASEKEWGVGGEWDASAGPLGATILHRWGIFVCCVKLPKFFPELAGTSYKFHDLLHTLFTIQQIIHWLSILSHLPGQVPPLMPPGGAVKQKMVDRLMVTGWEFWSVHLHNSMQVLFQGDMPHAELSG